MHNYTAGVRFDYGVMRLRERERPECAVPWCKRPCAAGRPGRGFQATIPVCEAHALCTRCGARIEGMRRAGFSGLITDCCGYWNARVLQEAWRIPWLLWLQLQRSNPQRVLRARIIVARKTIARGLPWPEDDGPEAQKIFHHAG
jgi:hypothetical protein